MHLEHIKLRHDEYWDVVLRLFPLGFGLQWAANKRKRKNNGYFFPVKVKNVSLHV
jgi:hypothetical protein